MRKKERKKKRNEIYLHTFSLSVFIYNYVHGVRDPYEKHYMRKYSGPTKDPHLGKSSGAGTMSLVSPTWRITSNPRVHSAACSSRNIQ